jgi:hypothetical protein
MISKQYQDMISNPNDYQETIGERSPMSGLKNDQAAPNKRSTSKFRSMDLTNQGVKIN